MTKKELTLSLIILVYNEELHIKRCLDSIAAQTVLPDEVIIVDNNCSDRTIQIAKKYQFVRIVQERRQGIVYARNKGFNSAKSDIIARIDADSILCSDWTEKIKAPFRFDEQLCGVAGLAYTGLFGYHKPRSTFYSRLYYHMTKSYFGSVTFWGGNMALRRSAWHKVRKHLSTSDRFHEDEELSLELVTRGYKLRRADEARLFAIDQSVAYLPKALNYLSRTGNLYKSQKKKGNLPLRYGPEITGVSKIERWLSYLMLPIVLLVITVNPILYFLPSLIALKVFKIPPRRWFSSIRIKE